HRGAPLRARHRARGRGPRAALPADRRAAGARGRAPGPRGAGAPRRARGAAAGAGAGAGLWVPPGFDGGPVVLCPHADVILGLLRFFELGETDAREGRPPCRKGSIWVLQGFGRTPTAATYLEPVARGGKPRFPDPEEARA